MSIRTSKFISAAAASVALMAMSSHALAQDSNPWFNDDSGWYWGAHIGYSSPDGVAFSTADPDEGWVGAIKVGKCCDGVRPELEFSHRSNDLPGGTGPADLSGDISVNALMFNVIADLNVSGAEDPMISPYVGVGAGYAWASADGTASGLTVDDDGGNFAGQLMAGISFNVSPQASVDVGYRYFDMLSTDITTSTGTVEESFSDHAFLVGFRWCFGQQPAPAPIVPAAAPAPQNTNFVIFFPWDEYALTPEAAETVREIALQFRDQPVSLIRIEGNTDTSGGDDYNYRLGQNRAESVKSGLLANGVPESLITTESLGETNPAVQTGDNVREPLNRRAEVIITLSNEPGV